MYDIFLKLLREEILSEKLLRIEPSRLKNYYEFLENSIENLLLVENESRKFFEEAVKNVLSDIEKLLSVRIAKKSIGSTDNDSSIDSDILSLIDLVKDFYSKYLAGFYITYEDKIAVQSLKKIYMNDWVIPEESIVLLGFKDALISYLKGDVKPLLKPYFNEVLSSK